MWIYIYAHSVYFDLPCLKNLKCTIYMPKASANDDNREATVDSTTLLRVFSKAISLYAFGSESE